MHGNKYKLETNDLTCHSLSIYANTCLLLKNNCCKNIGRAIKMIALDLISERRLFTPYKTQQFRFYNIISVKMNCGI